MTIAFVAAIVACLLQACHVVLRSHLRRSVRGREAGTFRGLLRDLAPGPAPRHPAAPLNRRLGETVGLHLGGLILSAVCVREAAQADLAGACLMGGIALGAMMAPRLLLRAA